MSDENGSASLDLNYIKELESRIRRLEDMHISILASMQFRPNAEYNQTLLGLNVYGDTRSALTTVMTAIMTRALGKTKVWNVHNLPEAAQRAAFVFKNGPITREDAVRAIALVIDRGEATAERVLKASKDSGYESEAHRILGT